MSIADIKAKRAAEAAQKAQATTQPEPVKQVPLTITPEVKPVETPKLNTNAPTINVNEVKMENSNVPQVQNQQDPNISYNNIRAEDDRYTLVDKESLEVTRSIDTGWGGKKLGYKYGVLDNDLYTDRSSKEKLKVADDNLVVKKISDVSNGALTLNRDDGTFTYIPNKGYSGEDNFTYQVCKYTLCSNVATAYITMKNFAPVAKDDSYKVRADTVLSVDNPKAQIPVPGYLYGVLQNDDDKNNNPLTAELVQKNGKDVGHGVLKFNKDGTFKYTPSKGYFGTDEFYYQAFDGMEHSNQVKVRISVERNNPPQAVDDRYEVKQNQVLNVSLKKDTTGLLGESGLLGKIASKAGDFKVGYTYGVLSNDVDSNGDALTAAIKDKTTHGDIVLNSDGTFRYTPEEGYVGDDSFTYQVDDGTLVSNIGTAYIIVKPMGDSEL